MIESMPDHKTISLKINNQIVDIDEEIAPLISWMNKIDGILTIFSCQGDDSTQQKSILDAYHCELFSLFKPYVAFQAKNTESLEILYRQLEKAATQVQPNSFHYYNIERYNFEFELRLHPIPEKILYFWHLPSNKFLKALTEKLK